MKNQIMSCGFLLIVMISASLSAQPYWEDWWLTGNSLGLTTEQMKQIQDIVIQWQEELNPIWSNLQLKNLELQRLMWDSTSDPAEVEAKSREVGDLQAKVQKGILERRAAVRELLTEQQQALYDIRGMGRGWGRGPCGFGLGGGSGGGFGWRGGRGWRMSPRYGIGARGSGWGRGPCGMGVGRSGWRLAPW